MDNFGRFHTRKNKKATLGFQTSSPTYIPIEAVVFAPWRYKAGEKMDFFLPHIFLSIFFTMLFSQLYIIAEIRKKTSAVM